MHQATKFYQKTFIYKKVLFEKFMYLDKVFIINFLLFFY